MTLTTTSLITGPELCRRLRTSRTVFYGLRVIQELAATQDYQVWIERVDSSGKIGIVMEDGAVRAVNEPAAESAALGGAA